MRNSIAGKTWMLAAVTAFALAGCGSSSDGGTSPAKAGSSGEDSAGGGMAGGGVMGDAGASSLTDVDQLCALDCGIGNSATGTAACQSDDCAARCAAKYNDDAVAAVDGCQAAFLAVLQCGATAPAIAWSCYNGMPFPLGSQACLPLGLVVAGNPDCQMALRNAQ